jgi:hypothetical protein
MASPKTFANVSSHMNSNLSLIKGIGPSIAGKLRQSGIHTFSQLASFSPIKLASKVNGLSSKRIAHQDWIGQARVLSGIKLRAKPPQKRTDTTATHHHYENFIIEFLLDKGDKIRRIRATHVQSGNTNTWTRWEDKLLLNFLVQYTGAHIQTTLPPKKTTSKSHKSPLLNESAASSPITTPISGTTTLITSEGAAPPAPTTSHPNILNKSTSSEGVLFLRGIKVVLADSGISTFFIRQNQPYLVRLILDRNKVFAQSSAKLTLKASVNFKQVGGKLQSVSETNRSLKLSEIEFLDITGPNLPLGIYRLSAFVRITSSDQRVPSVMASLDGNLLQVY